MRGESTPLREVIESFLMHRHDLSPASALNYRHWLMRFDRWCTTTLGRQAVVGDVEPGTVDAYLAELRLTSPDGANSTWVALRSFAGFLAELRIHHDHGESVLRVVRRPKVKDKHRRALSDAEMWRLIEVSGEGEQGGRDRAMVWTLLGAGLRRGELVGLQLGDVNLIERLIHVRAGISKSIHPREVAIPVELVKELDHYMADVRLGDRSENAPLFMNRHGGALTGNAIRLLFDRLKVRTGIADLCAHMLRHTWATNYNRSGSGSRFDLQTEGGWNSARMADRYCKVRPVDERRRAPSVFAASHRALAEKRFAEKRSPQQISALRTTHIA
jgi:integrase/recombinase XerC